MNLTKLNLWFDKGLHHAQAKSFAEQHSNLIAAYRWHTNVVEYTLVPGCTWEEVTELASLAANRFRSSVLCSFKVTTD